MTEASSIILLLLDSRCPPLHCPPSLRTYIQNLKPRKEVILVLTKSDLVDPDALAGWRSWLPQWWGDEQVQIVAARSYDVEALQGGESAIMSSRDPCLRCQRKAVTGQTYHAIPSWSLSKLCAQLMNGCRLHMRACETSQKS